MHSIYFKPGEAILFQVPPKNPLSGQWIKNIDDLFPKGFSEVELQQAMVDIYASSHDAKLVTESIEFADVDSYYNPGIEEIPYDYILEAIVVDKFSKTEHRMRAVVRTLNKHLAGNDRDIKALDPIVGQPKKAGSYAYVTVQLPFSDGQVVSVVFHAPEGDKRKIAPNDTIIAFRWLLNRRDITHVVAPEDGSEVSLETIAKRVSQLVVNNSERFERTQKESAEQRQKIEILKSEVKEAEKKQEQMSFDLETQQTQAAGVETELNDVLSALAQQKAINAGLEAELNGLQKALSDKQQLAQEAKEKAEKEAREKAEREARDREQAEREKAEKEAQARIEKEAREKAELEQPASEQKNAELNSIGQEFGSDFKAVPKGHDAREIVTLQGRENTVRGIIPLKKAVFDTLNKKYKWLGNCTRWVYPEIERGCYLVIEKNGLYYITGYTQPSDAINDETRQEYLLKQGTISSVKGIDVEEFAKEINAVADLWLKSGGQNVLTEPTKNNDTESNIMVGTDTENVPSNNENISDIEKEIVDGLNDIISGKYGDDADKNNKELLRLSDMAEKNGLMDKLDGILNEAADYLTKILFELAKTVL